ncbi:YjbF family lipoprotein [Vibrio ziniensis]|uniref:YjbF family lipoprotein n=1 Tax=Vibrio ziniensis TaxID=2711221 RepID=A0A6G7CGR9_9VIBR|nr:YjbF family lipoprotein [Vibrio ziniensis]QIH41274.1 YjbF family lipoprotein [Vibrio ziniensis]
MLLQRTFITVFTAISVLTGCSNNIKQATDSVVEYFSLPSDVELSDKADQIPYASILAKLDDFPSSLLILGAIEESTANQPSYLKWISSDKEMLVTQNGRLVKTVNLAQGNLLAISSTQTDPLSIGLHHVSTPKQWDFLISWQPGYHINYQAHSSFEARGEQLKLLPNGQTLSLLYFVETITIPALSSTYHNEYWLSPTSGEVISTKQHIAPKLHTLSLSVAKPFGSQEGL